MSEKEKEVIGKIDISKTVKSNIDYWRNKCFEQQKEIEKIKDKKDNIQIIYGGRRFGTEGMVVKDYISKDKMREKIKKAKEIKWHTPKLVIEYFEELLEEN